MGNLVLPVQRVQLSHTIDQLPQAILTVALDNRHDTVTDIDLKTFIGLCRDNQTYVANKWRKGKDAETSIAIAMAPDMKIAVTDGDGNKLLFSGVTTDPTFSVRGGSLALTYSGIQSNVVLQHLNTALYGPDAYYATAAQIALPNGTPYGSIAARMNFLTKSLLDGFKLAANPTAFQVKNYNELLPSHQVNVHAYEAFAKVVLENSYKSTVLPLLLESTADKNYMLADPAMAVNFELLRILTGSQTFMDAVRAMCASFKLQFNSDWGGNSWLEVIRMHEPPNGRRITVPVESITLPTSALVEAPLTKVYVRAGGNPFYATGQEAADQDVMSNMAVYPEQDPKLPPLAGVAYVTDAPEWVYGQNISLEYFQDVMFDGDKIGTVKAPTNLSLAGATSIMQKRDTWLAQQRLNKQGLLKWLAEFTFKEHFLKYVNTSISIPLAVSVEAGKTYDVYSSDGVQLFTGYLAQVSHTVELSGEQSSAGTVLMFTHVVVAGAAFRDFQATGMFPEAAKPESMVENKTAAPASPPPAPKQTVAKPEDKAKAAPVYKKRTPEEIAAADKAFKEQQASERAAYLASKPKRKTIGW